MLLYGCYVEIIPKIPLILLELRLKIIYFIIIICYIFNIIEKKYKFKILIFIVTFKFRR